MDFLQYSCVQKQSSMKFNFSVKCYPLFIIFLKKPFLCTLNKLTVLHSSTVYYESSYLERTFKNQFLEDLQAASCMYKLVHGPAHNCAHKTRPMS